MQKNRSLFTTTVPAVLVGMLLLFLFSVSTIAASQPLRPANTPPVAVFTVDPTSGVVGTWFYFDPSGTHDNEDSMAWLLIRYDWEDDGVYDTGWLNPTNTHYRHRYDAMGAYTVRMEVKDNDGLTDTITHDVAVGDPGSNTPPTPHCVASPTVGTVNTVFSFSAATSSDQQDATADLVARWAWHSGDNYNTDWLPATQDQSHQFSRHGLHEVRLEVRDTGTLSDDVLCTVDVQPEQPNTPPTARFTITPGQGDTTTSFTFDATASSDAEDGIAWLQVRYDWTDDGVYDTQWLNASGIQTYTFGAWGHLTVRMEVIDTGGLTDETARTVDITPFSLYLPLIN